jgi:hypothetical protein
MKNNVVEMGTVRDLLAALDELRRDVLAGEIRGWGGSVLYGDGREVVYLGGTFRDSAADRARCMLKVSAVRMQRDTPPRRKVAP